jgi:BolA protein
MTKAERIHDLLVDGLAPLAVQVIDESHMHSKGRETHYKVVIVADVFAGQTIIARHRAVHAALDELLSTKSIHALSIHAHSPAEWTARGEVVPDSPACRGGSKAERQP